jgi:hydrogenase nickel incorporation protein HypA/HybF
MHEIDLAVEIVALAREQMLQNCASRVTMVGLKVGELSCVAAEALRFAFDAAAQGTEVSGALLKIEQVAATARCHRHGVVTLQLGLGLVCPHCKTPTLELLSGEALTLETLEVV